RLDAPCAPAPRGVPRAGDVPAPLRPYVGADFASVPWQTITTGLSHCPLVTRSGTRARLIRAMPGAAVATHTHRGEEWTLVLTGSYSDASGRYAPGDVQSTTPQIKHKPTADPGPACINLAVTDAPLVFDGLIPKIAGWVFGF
ncbi:MAG TPA: cupin domain-containing protein, partial [Rhizomicrobium sp.]